MAFNFNVHSFFGACLTDVHDSVVRRILQSVNVNQKIPTLFLSLLLSGWDDIHFLGWFLTVYGVDELLDGFGRGEGICLGGGDGLCIGFGLSLLIFVEFRLRIGHKLGLRSILKLYEVLQCELNGVSSTTVATIQSSQIY